MASQQLTYVPNPSKPDGKLGTGSNQNRTHNPDRKMDEKYVPDPTKADGRPEE